MTETPEGPTPQSRPETPQDTAGPSTPESQPPPAPTYQAPGYQPPGNQAGYQPPPVVPLRPDEERTWGLLAHIGTLVLGFIAPLVVLLVQGEKSAKVREHSVESLNFQITAFIGYVVSWVLTFIFIGFITWFLVWVAAVVFAIIATIAASKGEAYKYPFALRLVK